MNNPKKSGESSPSCSESALKAPASLHPFENVSELDPLNHLSRGYFIRKRHRPIIELIEEYGG